VLQFQDGELNIRIPGMEFQLTRGTRIPFGPVARLWTDAAPATLQLSDGAIIYLDQYTTIYLTQISLPGSDQPPTILTLESGNLLVISRWIQVKSLTDVYQATDLNGIMGVSYQSASDIFLVDCLDGNCQLNSRTESAEIQTGQRAGFDRLIPIEVSNAQYEAWLTLGGAAVPTPSPTPTPLPTDTPTITPTPTRTPIIATAPPAANTPGSNQPPVAPTTRPRPTKPPPTVDPGGG
jgi:hypothetical protein